MAKSNKNLFKADSTWVEMFGSITDEMAGKLIKRLLSYSLGDKESTGDAFIDFAMNQFKDKIEHFQQISNTRADAGRLGGLAKSSKTKQNTLLLQKKLAKSSKTKQNLAKPTFATNEDKPLDFNFLNSLISLDIDKDVANDWIQVRRNKNASNTKTAFNMIEKEIKECNNIGLNPNDCIKLAVQKSWSGFYFKWAKNHINEQNGIKQNNGNMGSGAKTSSTSYQREDFTDI